MSVKPAPSKDFFSLILRSNFHVIRLQQWQNYGTVVENVKQKMFHERRPNK